MKLPSEPTKAKPKRIRLVLPQPAPVPTKKPKLVMAGWAEVGAYYLTAQSQNSKPLLCQLIGPKQKSSSGEMVVRYWDPGYEEWRDVDVPPTYKLLKTKESEMKIPKAGAVKKAGASKAERKSVPNTWGLAFKKHGTSKNAVKEIVSFMKSEFPDKETDWSKWVDLVRGRYNRGELGQPKPKAPLAPYNGKRSK